MNAMPRSQSKKCRKNQNTSQCVLVKEQLLSISEEQLTQCLHDSVCCAKTPYQYTIVSLLSINAINNIGYIALV